MAQPGRQSSGRISGHDSAPRIPANVARLSLAKFFANSIALNSTKQTTSPSGPHVYCCISLCGLSNLNRNHFKTGVFDRSATASDACAYVSFDVISRRLRCSAQSRPVTSVASSMCFTSKITNVGFTKGLNRVRAELLKLTVGNGDNNSVVYLYVGLLDRMNIK